MVWRSHIVLLRFYSIHECKLFSLDGETQNCPRSTSGVLGLGEGFLHVHNSQADLPQLSSPLGHLIPF